MTYVDPDPECPYCGGSGSVVVVVGEGPCDYDEYNCGCIEEDADEPRS